MSFLLPVGMLYLQKTTTGGDNVEELEYEEDWNEEEDEEEEGGWGLSKE